MTRAAGRGAECGRENQGEVGAGMSAQIINLQAWRVAHSERPALCLELLQVWAWPVRVWLALWGVR